MKIHVKGVEEIIIIDEIKYENEEDFFNDLSLGLPHARISVNWAEGIVFLHESLPWTDTTIKEYIEKGKIYWSYVRYAPMEKYQPTISKNGVVFVVRKTNVPALIDVAKELKKRIKKE